MQMERLRRTKQTLWVLIILQAISGYRSCLEQERLGLLDIKAYLNQNDARTDHLLPSWRDASATPVTDCCSWERVKCNNSTTARVVELSLNNMRPHKELMPLKFWFLNVSFFLPFHELRYLDLSDNGFAGCHNDHGFEKLSILKKLEVLNLGENDFDNSILPSLGVLTSLRTLNLESNRFEGSSPAKELATLNNLETLDLSRNYYQHSKPLQGFESLSALKTLVNLRLDQNGFDNSILSSLRPLINLKNLSLAANNLRGSFPCKEFGTLENLETLDLSSNNALSDPAASEECKAFKKLTTLKLDFNTFSNSILPFLSVFPSIETLSLSGNRLGGVFTAQELAALGNLTVLDLSFNSFSEIRSEGLGNLKKLETLNLAANHLVKSSLRSLGAITSLKSLDLRGNLMGGTFPTIITNMKILEKLDLSMNLLDGSLPIKELANMSNLKILNLENNLLVGTLQTEELATLKNLEILDLSGNQLFGYISPSIGSMTSLKALSLANNKLNGSLPKQVFCELKNLQELDLSRNNFSGVLPQCLSSLTSLRLLDLSFNQLEGNISSSPIPSLASLEYIDFSRNLFEGSFSFKSIANHTKLKVVMLQSDNNKLEVEIEYTSWFPKFQLTVLVMANCNLNKLPEFLTHQFELRVVDLSHNTLTGTFPNWLLENNINLDFLSLRNNSFIGQFYLSPNSSSKIVRMDISDNHFHGKFPENIGEMLPNAFYLNVSENAFEGSIPSSVCNIPSLLQLDLSSNNFSGEAPDKFAENCSSLLFLSLSNNRLRGQMPNLNASKLMMLHLSENQFSGTLPNGILQLSNLYNMDISGNYMSGEIPSFFGNMSSQRMAFIMQDNAFEGKIFCEMFASFLFLDLSYNSLSGPLPYCEFSDITHLNLQENKITGSIPWTLLNSSYLLTLNLKNNFLSGEIPTSVVANSDLRVLLLGGNDLSGLIPDQLCQFNKMGMLDLSQNSFSGSIPRCFNNITFGNIQADDSMLGVSWNIPLSKLTLYEFESLLQREIMHDKDYEFIEQVAVEFITKTRTNVYKGSILDLMSGLDLSCNHLTGEIPPELGKLSWIRALNLSHNQLTGSIPSAISNLRQIESLDLSYNNLSGEIPSALISLNFLQVFSVAHNNLSGRVPDMKAQFATFENSSYDGNPFLCGPPLAKSCSVVNLESLFSDSSEGKWYEIDTVVFIASFTAAYVMFLLGFLALLYINPYWRRRWFNFIEDCMYSCYYFTSDTFHKILAKLYR
uniref:LRR-RLK n=1 Tax=Vernicia fordii TaxID=73154 RepID=A0A127AVW3_VERFO|nr:LRR-RLK [Vernicia fordii]